jgi:hypothetical protein
MLECPHVGPGALYPEEVSACVLAQLLQVRVGGVGAHLVGRPADASRARPTSSRAAARPSRRPAFAPPQDAGRATGQGPISKAVISVPAYFDDAQREATIAAGARPAPGRREGT